MTLDSSTSRWVVLAAALAVTAQARAGAPHEVKAPPGPPPREDLVEAAPPPFSEGIFPCSECHDGNVDKTRRTLGFHEEVQERFEHNKSRRWCLDCHDAEKRDTLHLSSGERIPFTESYALCGQCHYDKYRDWRLGIHGKRVGHWDGQKTYLLCVSCHDPHSPRIKPIKPERAPRPPLETRQ